MKKMFIIVTCSFRKSPWQRPLTYTVEGMSCGNCAKMIKAEVCKMEGLEKCDVSLGKIVMTPKAGVKISQDQVQTAVTKAGPEYKIVTSKVSK